MQQRDNNKSVFLLTEAVAYFLAGSFAIKTVIPLHSSEGILQPGNLLVFVIGCILIIFGFFHVLIIFLSDHDSKFMKVFFKYSPYLYSILFSITTTEIVKVFVDFQKNPYLSWITIIFLVFVLVTIYYISFKLMFQNIRFLLCSCLYFNIMTGFLLFVGSTKFQVISFIVINSILICIALDRITRRAQRQHDIP
jgi:hypothetical protein